MKIEEILAKCDHTLLSVTATEAQIRSICDDGIKYGTASVCIPPSFIKSMREYVGDRLKLCTVIGFPNGYSAASVKAYEAEIAVRDGADEIDMVINVGLMKDRRYDELLAEINAVKAACHGRVLKVIVEACLLTEEEKIKVCEIVSASDADFIKTSTGFSTGGATFADIALFKKHVKGKKIKAAGGISSLADAEKFIELGADRLGTSKIVKLAKEEAVGEGY
ncbi:MAG: deoxyribose-phosphate aldolase [Clostridia bacterium]|nr:deoxyribose-phosphate aldolase [Clostridia bacterium]